MIEIMCAVLGTCVSSDESEERVVIYHSADLVYIVPASGIVVTCSESFHLN